MFDLEKRISILLTEIVKLESRIANNISIILQPFEKTPRGEFLIFIIGIIYSFLVLFAVPVFSIVSAVILFVSRLSLKISYMFICLMFGLKLVSGLLESSYFYALSKPMNIFVSFFEVFSSDQKIVSLLYSLAIFTPTLIIFVISIYILFKYISK